MKEFNLLLKYSLSHAGVKNIQLRSGVYPIIQAPLEPILPFLVVYINTTARLVCARSVISADISVDKHSFGMSFKTAPVIINNDLFSAICLSLVRQTIDANKLSNFVSVEDAMARFVDGCSETGLVDLDGIVNDALMAEYQKIISTIGKPLSLVLEQEGRKLRNGNEF